MNPKLPTLAQLKDFFSNRTAILLIIGCLLVAAWTLLRFSIQPIIFDAVGQQVLAHQWLHGFHSGAITGPTNYILKMLLIYIPVSFLPGSPLLKLISETIAINVATFITVFLGVKLILKRFKYSSYGNLWLVNLWTSVIAGSIYWVGFANSRNLEVAGGIWLIASGLCAPKKFTLKYAGLIVVFSSLLFFADPLQFYMVAVPTAAYLLIEAGLNKPRSLPLSAKLWSLVVVVGLVLSKILISISQHLWHVYFFPVGSKLPLSSIPHRSLSAAKQLVQLYSGSADLGKTFFHLNPVVFVVFALMVLVTALRYPKSRRILLWAALLICVDFIVYVLSGSSGLDTNSRYLIMTLPAVVVSFTVVLIYAKGLIRWPLYILMIAAVGLGSILLIVRTSTTFHSSFPQEDHYKVVDNYSLHSGYKYAYASMNTGIPATYLYNFNAYFLPLSCQPGDKLQVSLHFFDRSYIDKELSLPAQNVPLILDQGQRITNTPAICTETDIVKQLGQPISVQTLSDGSKALIYSAKYLKKQLPLPAIN